MHYILEFFSKLHNLDELIRWGGYIGLTLIIFAETGLFIGFFLPGDSLLVTAGLFAGQGFLNPFLLFVLVALAAIIGDTVGYEIGRASGKAMFSRKDSKLFKQKHLDRTKAFYEKHGGKTIIIARFMPIVRTFAPLIAGIAGMPYRTFAMYNAIGGVLWVGLMIGIGYTLGRTVPNVDKYIHYIIVAIIFVSILPGIIAYLRTGEWKRWFEKTPAA
ncbi:MAG: VTT domain-containing protein [Patescibacteria group bacterium]